MVILDIDKLGIEYLVSKYHVDTSDSQIEADFMKRIEDAEKRSAKKRKKDQRITFTEEQRKAIVSYALECHRKNRAIYYGVITGDLYEDEDQTEEKRSFSEDEIRDLQTMITEINAEVTEEYRTQDVDGWIREHTTDLLLTWDEYTEEFTFWIKRDEKIRVWSNIVHGFMDREQSSLDRELKNSIPELTDKIKADLRQDLKLVVSFTGRNFKLVTSL